MAYQPKLEIEYCRWCGKLKVKYFCGFYNNRNGAKLYKQRCPSFWCRLFNPYEYIYN